MVARKDGAERVKGGLLGPLFGTWRRWLSSASRALVEGARVSASQSSGSALAGWLGVGALLVGAAATVMIAPEGRPRLIAATAAIASLAWASIRYLLLRYSLRGENMREVNDAWAWGLVVYAFGVTPELRLVAWAASAGVTVWALLHGGVRRPNALRAVGIAWGAQAGFVALTSVARSVVVFVMAASG